MATKYKYDKDTDYAALMERAAQRGDHFALHVGADGHAEAFAQGGAHAGAGLSRRT